jgi:hypothetical protein
MDAEYRFHGRRILCVLNLDGTDGSLLRQAEALAQRAGADLVLLGVVPDIDEGILLHTITGFDRPLSEKLAAERIRELGEGVSVPYRTSVMIGSPYNCIHAAAREYSADIVMAMRPSPGRIEWAGLDMQTIFARLQCPFVTIPASSGSKRPIAAEVGAVSRLEHVASF